MREGEGGVCDEKWLWRKAREPWRQGDTPESCFGVGAIERVTGRKARGLQTEEIGLKCQTFFISSLSGRGKQTFYGNVFILSYANEIMLWNLPFFKMVPPKTNFFFSFLKSWAGNSSTNQYSYQLFYGWGMTHLVPSCLKNV